MPFFAARVGLAAAAQPGTGQPGIEGSAAVAVVLRKNGNEETKREVQISDEGDIPEHGRQESKESTREQSRQESKESTSTFNFQHGVISHDLKHVTSKHVPSSNIFFSFFPSSFPC